MIMIRTINFHFIRINGQNLERIGQDPEMDDGQQCNFNLGSHQRTVIIMHTNRWKVKEAHGI